MAHYLITHAGHFDLDAYLTRIGYDGPRTATLDVLRALHLRHTLAIPFENLNPLLRWPVELDTGSLMTKLVHERRGGYCFEQNILFGHALHEIGIRFRGLAARVVYNAPMAAVTPRSHMLLAIELDGNTWIADVGFGGLTLTAPLRLMPDTPQATPHEPFRLTVADAVWQLEARIRNEWTPMYRFTLETAYLADYEVASWYLCHHPGSRFIAELIGARPFQDGRYALRNNVLTTHRASGPSEHRALTTPAVLRAVLEDELGIHLPDAADLGTLLDRLAAMPAPAGPWTV